MVPMNRAVTLDYDPTNPGRQAIGTAFLSGCIAVAAVFRASDNPSGVSLLLSHFLPTGSQSKASRNIRNEVDNMRATGRALESVRIMAPGDWAKDVTTGYTVETPYATIMPDVNGYIAELGASEGLDTKIVGYIPKDPFLAALSENEGTMLAELYLTADGQVTPRILVEGYPR